MILEEQIFTENTAKKLCETVIPADIRETLKITLGDNRTHIPFHKQFYYKYEGQILRYGLDKTITLMAMIYNYSKQDIYKLKLMQAQLEEINKPENFYLTKISSNNNSMSGGNISTENMTGRRGDQALLLSKTDALSNEVTQTLGRGGTSVMNEDFAGIEEDWIKRDKLTETRRQSANITDIKLPEGELNLKEITTGPIVESQAIREPVELEVKGSEEQQNPEVFYTDLSLSKGTANTIGDSVVSGKNFNNAAVEVAVNKENVITNTQNTNQKGISVEFTKSEAIEKALDLYTSNFRESFLNSFYSLFISIWTGY